ncbi:hypothetical protein P12x_001441 [Tundrisphaera lichenicola]|uniref:hypothetical protein n=1 Tax=Tundrisphaera lichenicola TaxID=2029860 RepID=UPI003EBB3CA1
MADEKVVGQSPMGGESFGMETGRRDSAIRELAENQQGELHFVVLISILTFQ